MRLDQLAGRSSPTRRDSRDTRQRLIESVGSYVTATGSEPARLADVAAHAGVSVATAYRHFQSVDDVVQAHVLQLPEHAVRHFRRADRSGASSAERLHRWNRAWVQACLQLGPSAVHLRSTDGFLARRANADPVVTFVCDQVEPLLLALGDEHLSRLVIWNAVSDPREVLDLRGTLGWSREAIAALITNATIGVGAAP